MSEAKSSSCPENRIKPTHTLLTSQRFGVSNRATPAFASSVLEEHGLASVTDKTLVIDKK